MLTFWDTVRGCELADTLIRELPKLNANNKKTEEKLDALLEEVKLLRETIEKKGNISNG